MNRIKLLLNQRAIRLVLRDVNTLRRIIDGHKKQERRKRLIETIKSYNKGNTTKLPNEEILETKSYNIYPNYQKNQVSIINTYQVEGYE